MGKRRPTGSSESGVSLHRIRFKLEPAPKRASESCPITPARTCSLMIPSLKAHQGKTQADFPSTPASLTKDKLQIFVDK